MCEGQRLKVTAAPTLQGRMQLGTGGHPASGVWTPAACIWLFALCQFQYSDEWHTLLDALRLLIPGYVSAMELRAQLHEAVPMAG